MTVLDDGQDKSVARNQMLAIVLMTVLLAVSFIFLPKPAPVQEPPAVATPAPTENAPQESTSASPQAESLAGALPLPPVAVQTDPSADEVILENDTLRLVFTRVGARLKQAFIKLRRYEYEEVQVVPVQQQPIKPGAAPLTDVDQVYPLGLQFSSEELSSELDKRRFEASLDSGGQSATFTLDMPGFAKVVKRITLGDTPHVVNIEVEYQNLETALVQFGIDTTPGYWLYWGPNVNTGDNSRIVPSSFISRKEGKNTTFNTTSLKQDKPVNEQNVEWMAFKSAYFVVAMRPIDFDGAQAIAEGAPENFRFGVAAPRFSVEPQATDARAFRLYIGPSEPTFLATAWPDLPSVVRMFSQAWDFMDKFAKLMLGIMNWFYGIIPNYGIAIILVTILVRVCMYPLTLKSMKSMKRMQSLGPLMKELKEKYGDNQEELNKRTMELYRERGVNPVGGCLPMMLQMPVFFAFYRMLAASYELRGAPFSIIHIGNYQWISDLSQPDRLIHLPFMAGINLPLAGTMFEYLNILPILGAVALVLSMKLTPSGQIQNDQQKIMMTIMPFMMAFFCYNMAAGLNLYILISSLLGIIQTKLIALHKDEEPLPVKKTPAKRQHFYAAAQARKRQMARELKEAKRQPAARAKDSK